MTSLRMYSIILCLAPSRSRCFGDYDTRTKTWFDGTQSAGALCHFRIHWRQLHIFLRCRNQLKVTEYALLLEFAQCSNSAGEQFEVCAWSSPPAIDQLKPCFPDCPFQCSTSAFVCSASQMTWVSINLASSWLSAIFWLFQSRPVSCWFCHWAAIRCCTCPHYQSKP